MNTMNSSKELAIGSTVYNYIFFTEINNDWSFHVPEDYQHDFLRLTAAPETVSLPESQCVSTSLNLFPTQVRCCKAMFSPFVNILLRKYASPYLSHILL